MAAQGTPSPEQMYEHYFGPAIFRPQADLLLGYAKIEPHDHVLDLACGTGIVARRVAEELGPTGRLIGVDKNPGMIQVAKEACAALARPVEWHEADAAELPLGDGSVSLILCQQGLQFFSDKARAVAEMKRTLTRGGRAVCSVWQDLDRQPVYRALLEAEAEYLGVAVEEVATPFIYGDGDAISSLFERAGFADVEVSQSSLRVTFPDADRFAQLTLMAGAAVVPELSADESRREALLQNVARKAGPTIEQFRDGDDISFEMHTHIIEAYS